MKANRLVERLKTMLEAIEVEPPVNPQAGFPRELSPLPSPVCRASSHPQLAGEPQGEDAVKVEMRARGVRIGWLAASLPPAHPRFDQAALLARAVARLLSARLAELGALNGKLLRGNPRSPYRFVFEAGDDAFNPAVQPLSQALVLNSRSAGRLQAQAAPEQAELFRAVAEILSGRLEELALKERLEKVEAEAAQLRGRLKQFHGD